MQNTHQMSAESRADPNKPNDPITGVLKLKKNKNKKTKEVSLTFQHNNL